MSLTKKTVKYILSFLGILIFLGAYLFVYTDYTEKTDALNEEIAELNSRYEELSAHHAQIPAYENSIEENKVFIDKTLSKYYSAETPEDFIMFATDMENTLGVKITGLSFAQPVIVSSVSALQDTGDYTEPPQSVTLTGFKLSSTIDGTMNYGQMKSALDFIYAQPDVTKLDSINLNYDSSTGLILSNFVLDKYYITGRDIQEHQAAVNYTNLGKSVLIGN
ncbi:MAG: hypothetical protein GX847_00550 [Clostridiales bacterium]|nr:hypothetical protein [Clostridiales bacterium]